MNKLVKRLLTGTLAFATILTALPVTAVHASGNQYWTESAERVGYIEHVMNDGSIKSTFNEGADKRAGALDRSAVSEAAFAAAAGRA